MPPRPGATLVGALDEAQLEHHLRRAAFEMGAELQVGRVENGEWLASFRKYSVPKEFAPEGANSDVSPVARPREGAY